MSTINISVERSDSEPLAALRALHGQERVLAQTKRQLIAGARARGHSWAEIGAVLEVSKQAAWELYSADVAALLDAVADRSGLTEDEAMRAAIDEVAAVRQARPRRRV